MGPPVQACVLVRHVAADTKKAAYSSWSLGERLGASRAATNRALSALRITVISSGRGPACSPTLYLGLIHACEWCVSKLACLLVVEASPYGSVNPLWTQGLWLSPTADQHNEIPPGDSHGHVKPPSCCYSGRAERPCGRKTIPRGLGVTMLFGVVKHSTCLASLL
ncbi:unnamed protein product [Pleuronectes platessa]|uniref:Uncharacterized protein n=1 Tax=Pleuronectes platessa TaxID=8262 RepID=A0A9N7YRL8_PLEPL|nr:unnamed protein product [Pleuronectes platessa]